MSRHKYTSELKIKIAKEYLSGEGSYRELSARYGVSKRIIEVWAKKYKLQGQAGLLPRCSNSSYSSDFKKKCVEAVLRGEGSVDDIVAKYNISAGEVLRDWIKRYNANKELKDYDPKREVYENE